MPSSISVFDSGGLESRPPHRAVRAIVQLLAGCAVLLLGVETVSRLGFDRSSKVQRRIAEEYRIAKTIGSGDAHGARQLLAIGNSLLEEDIDFDQLCGSLAGWNARRFTVEETYY